MKPTIWCIVITDRAKSLSWALNNFYRQTYVDKKLLIVENGEAIGACERQGVKADRVITSEHQVSAARNAGIYDIVDNGGGWVTMMDDDDYYGPNYLQELAVWLQSGVADIYGKHRHFIAYGGNGMYLYNVKNALRPTRFVHGPTLAFRAEEALRYNLMDSGEEVEWGLRMTRLGFKIFATTIHNYLYLRKSDAEQHTWQANQLYIHRTSRMNDYHYWFDKVNLDVVNNVVPWEPCATERMGVSFPEPMLSQGIVPVAPSAPMATPEQLRAIIEGKVEAPRAEAMQTEAS